MADGSATMLDALERRLGAFPRLLARLQRTASASALFAEAAELTRVTGEFDRAIVLSVEGETLTTRGCAPLDHGPSDIVRRRFLREPIQVPAQTREAQWIALASQERAGQGRMPSVLADEVLGLGTPAVGLIAAETEVLAFIVGFRSDGGPSRVDQTTVAGMGALTGVVLTRLVQTARLEEVTGALRHLSYSTQALIEEVLRAPVRIPHEYHGRPTFPPVDLSPRNAPDAVRMLLTAREIEVAEMLADGRSNQEIGTRLVISVNTAKDHVKRVREKLQAANRAEAASKYLRLRQGL